MIQLSGPELAELRAAAGMIKGQLARFPGVIDIRDTFRGGKQELELEILPSAESVTPIAQAPRPEQSVRLAPNTNAIVFKTSNPKITVVWFY